MAVVIQVYNDMTDHVAWFLIRRRWGRLALRERLWLIAWARYLWGEEEHLVNELIRLRAWAALERLATDGDA